VGHGLVTGVVVADRSSYRRGRAAGSEREGERRGMTSGAALLARESLRARVAGPGFAGPRAEERASARGRARARGRAAPCWAELEERRSRPELKVLFSLFQKCE
jgi:hypothetical protein